MFFRFLHGLQIFDHFPYRMMMLMMIYVLDIIIFLLLSQVYARVCEQ